MSRLLSLAIFAIAFGAMQVQASETVFNAKVKTGYCGEIDPYVIGDACIAVLTVGSESAGNLHVVVLLDQTEDSDSSKVGEIARKVGKTIKIDPKQLKPIKKSKLLDALNQEVENAVRNFVLNRHEARAKRAFATFRN